MKRQIAAATVLTASSMISMGATAGTANAESGDRAYWSLDEAGSPITAFDSAGTNHGMNQNIVGTGEGYVFNGTNSRVIVQDHPSLNPGLSDFSYGATIIMDAPPGAGDTDDILRKGITTSRGGEYKLEVKNANGAAKARCAVKDANKVAAVIAFPRNLTDGVQHTITCTKTSTGVAIRVDGFAPRTKTVAALASVSNVNNLALGAKAEANARSGFDWFQGTLLQAWVR